MGNQYYASNVGIEMQNYLQYISTNYFGFDIITTTYDYYRNTVGYQTLLTGVPSPVVPTYLTSQLTLLQQMITNYNNNFPLLGMTNIILGRSQWYFATFASIVNELTNIIQTTPNPDGSGLLYSHVPYLGPDDIVLQTQAYLLSSASIYPQNTAGDIVLKMRVIANAFFASAGVPIPGPNPYNPLTDPNKYNLWQQYNGTFQSTFQQNLFARSSPTIVHPPAGVFDWLYLSSIPVALFGFITQIDAMYDGFAFENNVYQFMSDYVIQQSIVKDLPALIGSTVAITNTNVLVYYETILAENNTLIEELTGTTGSTSLFVILQRSLTGQNTARFAWIQKIGHYIIKQIWFQIDDQIIDMQYGEWLEIWHELTKRIKKEPGYNTLIGNVSQLYTFNNAIKNEYELIIPLQFWFCRNVGLSLPLLALHNAEVRLYTSLKPFNELAYYDNDTTFGLTPRLKCNILAEYIYVDDDERNKISTSKLEYLVDVIQYNGEIKINNNSFDEDGYVQALTRFKNPCKELYWMLQRNNFIDGTLPNGQLLWDQYSYNIDGTVNPVNTVTIQFNAREREPTKESEYFNYIQPYEKHYSDPNTGINIYSFSLNPESIQPEGSANMSRIDDVIIRINMKPNVQSDLNNNLVTFRWPIYALTINLLRIFSGLGGLVFEQ